MEKYGENSYRKAMENTKYNEKGDVVIEVMDEWREEKEWDELYEVLKQER